MNVLMLMAVLFLPVFLIIMLAIYTQKKARRKKQGLLLLYLQENFSHLRGKESRHYWLDNQLLAVYPDAATVLLLKQEGPLADAAIIPIETLERIEFFRETASMRTDEKSSREDLVVMRMGLLFHYNYRKEELVCFNYATEQSSQLPEKEKLAENIRQEIVELKNVKKQ